MFVCFSLIKIIALYLLIYIKHTFARIIAINGFIIYFVFCFGVSILYAANIISLQIHSIVCKCTIRLKLRLKVNYINQIKVILISVVF